MPVYYYWKLPGSSPNYKVNLVIYPVVLPVLYKDFPCFCPNNSNLNSPFWGGSAPVLSKYLFPLGNFALALHCINIK